MKVTFEQHIKMSQLILSVNFLFALFQIHEEFSQLSKVLQLVKSPIRTGMVYRHQIACDFTIYRDSPRVTLCLCNHIRTLQPEGIIKSDD